MYVSGAGAGDPLPGTLETRKGGAGRQRPGAGEPGETGQRGQGQQRGQRVALTPRRFGEDPTREGTATGRKQPTTREGEWVPAISEKSQEKGD